MTDPKDSLIEKLEKLYFPDDAGIAPQSVADNNMAIVKAIAVVRQHESEVKIENDRVLVAGRWYYPKEGA